MNDLVLTVYPRKDVPKLTFRNQDDGRTFHVERTLTQVKLVDSNGVICAVADIPDLVEVRLVVTRIGNALEYAIVEVPSS